MDYKKILKEYMKGVVNAEGVRNAFLNKLKNVSFYVQIVIANSIGKKKLDIK